MQLLGIDKGIQFKICVVSATRDNNFNVKVHGGRNDPRVSHQ